MWREEDEAGGTAAEALLSEEIVREFVNGVWVTHPKAVSSGGASYTGDIAEVLIYARALNAAERRQVIEYLSAKWATP